MKANCWLTKMKFSPEGPSNLRWHLGSMSDEKGLIFSGLFPANSPQIPPSAPHDWYLVAGVNSADLTDLQVMQGHQQLCPQRAVVDIPGAQEQRPQELQHHVIELHVLPDHLRQLLHHLSSQGEKVASAPRDALILLTHKCKLMMLGDLPRLKHLQGHEVLKRKCLLQDFQEHLFKRCSANLQQP